MGEWVGVCKAIRARAGWWWIGEKGVRAGKERSVFQDLPRGARGGRAFERQLGGGQVPPLLPSTVPHGGLEWAPSSSKLQPAGVATSAP